VDPIPGDAVNAARARLNRIRGACEGGRALAPEDAAMLVAAIEAWLRDGVPIDDSLGLGASVREIILRELRMAALAALARGEGSARSRARALYAELRRYGASYAADCRRRAALAGRRAELHRLIAANGGEVPSYDALRKWLK
jgi:hypothetical protein